ncbi:EAL domain-containing protein (putative c-di-GMP-specific phosphodiesterase class I) [Planomonospora venezuelensis]|uniref:EAL domain-containing protein (Putative c-di-GMP-specific phosphodiesterase class I) n=1 Tax=Planomonospora venezuelensis TaxID=1999 RepID=A0A841CXY1_PLAVE|nr:EAL domain-containing protein (putative c-di-GMP-specific phosphodiesterase class I) [Planomonospora venezuelensis]
MRAVAEGVETADQAERLYQLGYRLAQGFHFARPLPPAEIERRLAGRSVPAGGDDPGRWEPSSLAS